ncbi:putative lipid phosphate phosphatase 3, chloroplastic isoform X6 [Rhododendron vialii]|uniref:putative lipid phosphate phosphatase 3, chloroplastic isoform X6 n=1 Tax=Rhododendron vialii TaxID=182163 RepID=UPI00265F2B27|nr:putative lipid phosphate phosphatase 3, chloroplastic isoform X6 [Rhododendron vialii]
MCHYFAIFQAHATPDSILPNYHPMPYKIIYRENLIFSHTPDEERHLCWSTSAPNSSPGEGSIWLSNHNLEKMMELGSHTVRSHGVTVAWTHMYDWLILMLLVAIYVILNRIDPFHRFVGKDMMDDLKYPLKDNTVPSWSIPIYAILLPIVIFLFFYFRRRDVYDLHHAILGLLYSVFITAVITSAVKDAVGRPRPHFFWGCFPDGKEVYDQWGDVICHGEKNVIKEGYKSFPSGHTSGWGPYAYFRVVEELHASTQAANNVNTQNGQPREAHLESQHHERSSNAFIGISIAGDTSSTLEDLESGRSFPETLPPRMYFNCVIHLLLLPKDIRRVDDVFLRYFCLPSCSIKGCLQLE